MAQCRKEPFTLSHLSLQSPYKREWEAEVQQPPITAKALVFIELKPKHLNQRVKKRGEGPEDMVDQFDCILSLISLLLHLFHVLRKAISMALCSTPTTHGPPPPPLSWKRLTEPPMSAHKRQKEDAHQQASNGFILEGCRQESLALHRPESIPKGVALEKDVHPQENPCLLSRSRGIDAKVDILMNEEGKQENCPMVQMLGSDSMSMGAVGAMKESRKLRKRPGRIVIPESCVSLGFIDAGMEKDLAKELEVEGNGYCLASRKGSRHMMEDGYEAITNIQGDSKQAFFGVFDGHGGRAAVDFASEKLGKNIITALSKLEEDQPELAIRAGYLTTDREFLSQGVSSGTCAATVLLKNGELHVSNVGDCRVVMSRKGVATALTHDHRAGREDERTRIESSGGFVTCRNGVWRVQDSLAISRAIGDVNMKEWVISEPETKRFRLTPDCEFLIMASDGLWDKVSNQEAVDVVLKQENTMKSCKDLVDISSRRGSTDDITVMVVDLRRFVQH